MIKLKWWFESGILTHTDHFWGCSTVPSCAPHRPPPAPIADLIPASSNANRSSLTYHSWCILMVFETAFLPLPLRFFCGSWLKPMTPWHPSALPLFSRWRWRVIRRILRVIRCPLPSRLLQLLLGAELVGVSALLLAAVPERDRVAGWRAARVRIKGCQPAIDMVR